MSKKPEIEDYFVDKQMFGKYGGASRYKEFHMNEYKEAISDYCSKLEKTNRELKRFKNKLKKEYDKNSFSSDNVYEILEKEFGEKYEKTSHR